VTVVSEAIRLREGEPADAAECGRICYEAFRLIAEAHGFPPDFPSAHVAAGLLAGLLEHPGYYSVVAERDGRILGSNFLDERSPIAGLGPITVDPATQNARVGYAKLGFEIREPIATMQGQPRSSTRSVRARPASWSTTAGSPGTRRGSRISPIRSGRRTRI
jgi:hypothetical protein